MGSVARARARARRRARRSCSPGHIDEIGLMVNYITPEGFIAFKADRRRRRGRPARACACDVHTKGGAAPRRHRAHAHPPARGGRAQDRHQDAQALHRRRHARRRGARSRSASATRSRSTSGFETFGDGMAVVARASTTRWARSSCAEVLQASSRRRAARRATSSRVATVQEEVGLRGGVDLRVRHRPGRRHRASRSGTPPTTRTSTSASTARSSLRQGPDHRARRQHQPGALRAARRGRREGRRSPYQIGAEPRGTGTDANADPALARRQGRRPRQRAAALHAHADRGALARGPRGRGRSCSPRSCCALKPGTDFTP